MQQLLVARRRLNELVERRRNCFVVDRFDVAGGALGPSLDNLDVVVSVGLLEQVAHHSEHLLVLLLERAGLSVEVGLVIAELVEAQLGHN